MKIFNIAALLAFAPGVVFAACNADNVLRALQANAAKASPFCSTYTLPPPNQPLPTYISQYPASRVSSGCSCLITPGPTTLSSSTTTSKTSSLSTSSTSTTSGPQCSGELIRNGNFQYTTSASEAPPWEFAPIVYGNPGPYQRAQLGHDNGNSYALLEIENSTFIYAGVPGYSPGWTTYVRQTIPSLCRYGTYTLSYDADTKVESRGYTEECVLDINVSGTPVVQGSQGTPQLPFGFKRQSFTFKYRECPPYGATQPCYPDGPPVLTVRFSCRYSKGSFQIDNISLVGTGP